MVQPDSIDLLRERRRSATAGRILHDHHPYGDLTVEDILVKSSNIGAAKLAMGLGEQRFYEYIRGVRIRRADGRGAAGRNPGAGASAARWSKISITRIPMGQEVAVTPLQTIVGDVRDRQRRAPDDAADRPRHHRRQRRR